MLGTFEGSSSFSLWRNIVLAPFRTWLLRMARSSRNLASPSVSQLFVLQCTALHLACCSAQAMYSLQLSSSVNSPTLALQCTARIDLFSFSSLV